MRMRLLPKFPETRQYMICKLRILENSQCPPDVRPVRVWHLAPSETDTLAPVCFRTVSSPGHFFVGAEAIPPDQPPVALALPTIAIGKGGHRLVSGAQWSRSAVHLPLWGSAARPRRSRCDERTSVSCDRGSQAVTFTTVDMQNAARPRKCD